MTHELTQQRQPYTTQWTCTCGWVGAQVPYGGTEERRQATSEAIRHQIQHAREDSGL